MQLEIGFQKFKEKLMTDILYLAANALHIYSLYIFIDSFLGRSKINSKIKFLIYFVYYLMGILCWLFVRNMTLNLFVNTVPLFLITLQYESSLKKKVFSTISSCAVGMFIDWVAVSIFDEGYLISSGFVQCITLLVLASLFRHYYVNRELYQFKSRYSWLLTVISAGTVAIGVLTVDEETTHDAIIAIILLLINFLNFYIYNIEQKFWQAQHRLNLIEISNGAYQNQLKIMSEAQQKIRFMRHDLRKHLNRIRGLVEEGCIEDIPKYLDMMEESVIIKREFCKTGNSDVDSMINYELTIAYEFGTEIFCDIDLPDQLNVTSFDMTVILGNILDNAVEALRQSEKKVLIITIKFNKGIIRIDIENSYNSKFKRKTDGREHGIGLLSVTNTIEKYHGSLKTFPEGDKYHTTVVLFNSFS